MNEKRLIPPSVGRVVHYYPNGPAQKEGGDQPEAAVVAFVHNDRLVNLTAFSPSGHPYAVASAVLRQPDDVIATGGFAEWMNYQVGQSEKTAEVEGKVIVRLIEIEARLAKIELMAHPPVPAAGLVAEAMKSDDFRDAMARADKGNPIKTETAIGLLEGKIAALEAAVNRLALDHGLPLLQTG